MSELIYVKSNGELVLKDSQERDEAKRYYGISNAADGTPRVVEMTAEEQAAREAEEAAAAAVSQDRLLEYCRDICAEKLSVGFDYTFSDARGVHRIGTTERDLKGWDEVRALANAYREASQPDAEITIATDTGSAVITAAEWPPIDIAAGVFRQPIWAASFAIQAKIAAGQITSFDQISEAVDWP